ncbi:MAG: DUF5681 domain-containing protein [Pseudomonadota bacterium]
MTKDKNDSSNNKDMVGTKTGQPLAPSGYRKDGKPYKEGNVQEDGNYIVGRNRPPKHSRFAKGDGRKRGRRKKGVANADTEFLRELNRKVTIRENGKLRKVTKSNAVDLRLLENAVAKGQNRAIEMVDERRQRIAQNAYTNRNYHTLSDREILREYLQERAAEFNIDPNMFGDPDTSDTVNGEDDG